MQDELQYEVYSPKSLIGIFNNALQFFYGLFSRKASNVYLIEAWQSGSIIWRYWHFQRCRTLTSVISKEKSFAAVLYAQEPITFNIGQEDVVQQIA
ncbi:hypothetical protein [Chryseobacterium sp. 5_R23647]|uniref:hypothetical protein n=1 Tax=Chryseobacterium sp. 5_R23647 TaxID=2258964 RepID=UPI000E282E24|nr:hypothetical protein [Chryseobacterium sp. 5_R23647]REC42585.1 hypothetical protein DRF69_11045 [Chryseobacterium sp. 5_R23647]